MTSGWVDALAEAIGSGLTKLVVEVVAEQGAALALFTQLGFTGEALLVDHLRDRSGQLRDLMVLAHHVRDTWAGMDAVEEELSAGECEGVGVAVAVPVHDLPVAVLAPEAPS